MVLANLRGTDIILSQTTSHARTDEYSVPLEDAGFASGRLMVSSRIRPNRLFTADSSIVLYRHLASPKVEEVLELLVAILRQAVCEVRKVLAGGRMALEQIGNDVCIDDDGSAHAARSDLLCPRHSWRAARNSSMGSSSGQKSPNRTLGSWMGPFPCWAINSSTVGLA